MQLDDSVVAYIERAVQDPRKNRARHLTTSGGSAALRADSRQSASTVESRTVVQVFVRRPIALISSRVI